MNNTAQTHRREIPYKFKVKRIDLGAEFHPEANPLSALVKVIPETIDNGPIEPYLTLQNRSLKASM